jgi:hypothetical protein
LLSGFIPSLKSSEMNRETKKRLRAMGNKEGEKRLDELNQKLGITLPDSVSSHPEEFEEREWLKKKLGYKQH